MTKKLVFVNVSILPMIGNRIMYNKDVVVENDKITSITDTSDISRYKNSEIIDSTNKYLMPGLIDAHIHLYSEEFLDMFLSYGVTSALNMSAITQDPRWVEFYFSLKKSKKVMPLVLSTGPMLDSYPLYPITKVVSNAQQAINEVIKTKKAGYDFVKIYNNLTFECHQAILKTAKDIGIEVVGHLNDCINPYYNPNKMQIHEVDKIEQKSIEHIVFISNDNMQKVIDSGTYLTPTMYIEYLMQHKDDSELKIEFSKLRPELLSLWQEVGKSHSKPRSDFNKKPRITYGEMQSILKRFYDNGGKLLLGTDTGMPYIIPGYSLHKEMEQFSKAGIPNAEILKIATLENARHLKINSKFGTIEVGKKADLLLLNENPLKDINNTRDIFGVVKLGHWYNANDLEALKASVIKRKNEEIYIVDIPS